MVLQEDRFTVFSNQKLLSQPLCRFATSKPDLAFFHRENYAFNESVVGCIGIGGVGEEAVEENPYTLTGAFGEDKPPGLIETGESQVVASMVLLAATLGVPGNRRKCSRRQTFLDN